MKLFIALFCTLAVGCLSLPRMRRDAREEGDFDAVPFGGDIWLERRATERAAKVKASEARTADKKRRSEQEDDTPQIGFCLCTLEYDPVCPVGQPTLILPNPCQAKCRHYFDYTRDCADDRRPVNLPANPEADGQWPENPIWHDKRNVPVNLPYIPDDHPRPVNPIWIGNNKRNVPINLPYIPDDHPKPVNPIWIGDNKRNVPINLPYIPDDHPKPVNPIWIGNNKRNVPINLPYIPDHPRPVNPIWIGDNKRNVPINLPYIPDDHPKPVNPIWIGDNKRNVPINLPYIPEDDPKPVNPIWIGEDK